MWQVMYPAARSSLFGNPLDDLWTVFWGSEVGTDSILFDGFSNILIKSGKYTGC